METENGGGGWGRVCGESDFLRLRCCLGEGGCLVAVKVMRGLIWRLEGVEG
jgi:hypothetical protein